jgi:hypothetical protein
MSCSNRGFYRLGAFRILFFYIHSTKWRADSGRHLGLERRNTRQVESWTNVIEPRL